MEIVIIPICSIVALFGSILALRCIHAQRRIHWLLPSSVPAPNSPKISVIIPARNEECDLGASLRSVLDQEGVQLEVIIVDDHSTDRTGEMADGIARSDERVKVVHRPPLTPGWLGKCNAMQYGADRATGEYLLFTDADIIHSPGCFASAFNEMQRCNYDFISLFPLMENHSFWENVNLPIYFFGFAKFLSAPGLEEPDSANAAASGALMLISRPVFNAIEGFQSVKGEMFDDVGLARVLKREKFQIGYRFAPECLKVRLFKSNRDAFWGTTKNILMAVEGRWWLAIPMVALGIIQYWTPLLAITLGIFAPSFLLIIVGLGTFGLQYFSFFSVRRVLHFRPLKLLFFPLSVVVAACCMGKAFYHLQKGTISWRGREIKVQG